MTTDAVNIDGKKIGSGHPPFVIAEISANHHGSLERALLLLEQAKAAGADAVKLQSYTPESLTLDCDAADFQITQGLWAGSCLHALYKQGQTPYDWHPALFAKAKELDIVLFSSPFDNKAVELLEQLDAPAYKIASFELVDLPLIKRVAQTKKPMLLSTGLANEQEISQAVITAQDNGCTELILLHCISAYPADAANYNLRTMADMAARFNLPVGISDHSLSNTTAIAAVALGACVIEKHLTLDKTAGGLDDSFSLEPAELALLCQDANIAWRALGKVDYQRSDAEKQNRQFRRSLYVVRDIAKGELFTAENIRSIRPAFGLEPKYYEQLLGKKASSTLKKGAALTWDDIAD